MPSSSVSSSITHRCFILCLHFSSLLFYLSFYFREKVTTIEESKNLDEIKIQEFIGSLQTYELGLPSHKSCKSLALKTIIERMDDSSEEDDMEKEVAFLAKNF